MSSVCLHCLVSLCFDEWPNKATIADYSKANVNIVVYLFSGYPVGFAYRRFIHSSHTKVICQLFLIASGALLYIFNYGLLIYHSILAVVATFAFIQFLPAKTLLVPVSFVFHMAYLLIGKSWWLTLFPMFFFVTIASPRPILRLCIYNNWQLWYYMDDASLCVDITINWISLWYCGWHLTWGENVKGYEKACN